MVSIAFNSKILFTAGDSKKLLKRLEQLIAPGEPQLQPSDPGHALQAKLQADHTLCYCTPHLLKQAACKGLNFNLETGKKQAACKGLNFNLETGKKQAACKGLNTDLIARAL